jgi:hypothetical protein
MKEFIGLWPIALILLGIILTLILPEPHPSGVIKIKPLDEAKLAEFRQAWNKQVNHIDEARLPAEGLNNKEQQAFKK